MQQLLKGGSLMALAAGMVLWGAMNGPTTALLKNREMLTLGRVVQPSEKFLVRVPEDFSTIQAAVDAVAEGGTVLVGPGLYKENVQITKSIRLIGVSQEQVRIQAVDDQKPVFYVTSQSISRGLLFPESSCLILRNLSRSYRQERGSSSLVLFRPSCDSSPLPDKSVLW